jgi:HSP20 family protein
MPISRWEPFRELATMQRGLNRIFSDAFPHAWERPFRGDEPDVRVWAPAVDIFETDKNMVFKVELAGVDPNDVEIRVEGNTLYLRGQRKADKDAKDQKYHQVERFFGSFARSFTLPRSVDGGQVAAEYHDGILTLTLPKKEEAKPKTIKINVSRS